MNLIHSPRQQFNNIKDILMTFMTLLTICYSQTATNLVFYE